MRKIGLLALCSCLFAISAMAQQVSGNVKDQQGKPLTGSTVSLLNAKDSAVVKLAATTPEGNFSFTPVKAGRYIVSTTHVGYAPVYSQPFEFSGSGETKVPGLALAKLTGEMKGVVVTAKKPQVEVKADKTILNVEGTISSVGTDAFELLRKAPGVTIDKDDNISLAGKNGLQIYIDGRPTPLSGADLAAYLKTLQSSSIESIEIITNPSAKYDAAGNAGIINIRLKKNQAYGTNGSVNAGYAIGIYPKYNAGFTWNHRNKNINIFGSYTYNRNRTEMFIKLHREQLDTLFDQHSIIVMPSESHNYKAGFDLFISKKSTFGVIVSGTKNDNRTGNRSVTDISYIPTKLLNKTLIADNSTVGERNNVNVNTNYRFDDSKGHELNLDANYGSFKIRSNQLQGNYYYSPSGNPTETRIYNFIAPTDIDLYNFKADYDSKTKTGTVSVGGKWSYVKTTNDFGRYDVVQGGKNYDSTRSNKFDYKENINALYVNYNTQMEGGVMVQIGLRMESTTSEGKSNGYKYNGSSYDPSTSSFKRNYTDFFPSAALTFNKNPMSQLGFRYSRRIDRPAYQDLNPFEFKLDEYTYQKGNTELTPQYTNSFAITHTYKYKLTSTLNYSHVNDVFTQLIDTAEKSKAFITKKNLATQDIASLNVSYPFMYKTYMLFANFNGSYSHYKADFGSGRQVDLDAFSYNIFMQNSLKFAKVYTAELSGWYNSPGIWGGTFKSNGLWSMDAGLMKVIFKGQGNIKIAVSDIFQTLRWQGVSNFAGQYLKVKGGPESRQFKVNLTYRFGSTKVKAERQRNTGSEDESKRVSTQGSGIGNQ